MLYFLPIPPPQVWSLVLCQTLFKVDSSHPGPEGSAPNYRAAVITEPGWREKETEENLNPAAVNLDDCLPMIPVFSALRGANNPISGNNGYTPALLHYCPITRS